MHKAVLLIALLTAACNPAQEPGEAATLRDDVRAHAKDIARANVKAGIPDLGPGEIFFGTSGCFGLCPAFSFVIGPDGKGTFNGTRHVASEGEHAFFAGPAQFAAFAESVARFRPEGLLYHGEFGCPHVVPTDGPTLRVAWPDGDVLVLYSACEVDSMPNASEELDKAWRRLPDIVSFVGTPKLG